MNEAVVRRTGLLVNQKNEESEKNLRDGGNDGINTSK